MSRSDPEKIARERAKAELAKRAAMAEKKAEAEEDFLAFVRMMWPVLEPETPLVEGWLLDMQCLPYEAEIITENGSVEIGRYVESGCDARVLSFSHQTGKPEWKSVAVRQKSSGKPLIKIMLCDTLLPVTDDHPVFVKGRGYVRASEVRVGETVLRVRQLRKAVSALARGRTEPILQPPLPLPARHKNGPRPQATRLCRMWDCFFAGFAGDKILWPGLRRPSPTQTGNGQMPALRGQKKLGINPVPAMREQSSHNRIRVLLRTMWRSCVANLGQNAQILRPGVFWSSQPRREQYQFCPWEMDGQISYRVLAGQAGSPQAGRQGLFALPRSQRASYASYRPQPAQQRDVQPCDALPSVPPSATWNAEEIYTVVESDVLAVERDIRVPAAVYNLAVEGNHNYFAAGVLVHNCDVLMAITDDHLTRVCINVPPGSAKSSLLNVFWPAWEWGPQNKPHFRYLSISYSTSIPERDNVRFARVINHPVYRRCWGDRFKITREGMELVENDSTGWKRVTSTGGGVTGWRGDRILLDDINNPTNIESEEVRVTSTKFIREIMPDRLNSLAKSAIINLQQRTHQSDATGTLIEHGKGYAFFCVPMEFDPLRIGRGVLRRNDDGSIAEEWIDPRALGPDGRILAGLTTNRRGEPEVTFGSPMAKAEGALCWPARFAPGAVADLKKEKGSYAWDSQYNQMPGIRGGSVIKRDWWKLWQGDFPDLGTVIVSLDTAVEMNETNDFNACTVWGAFAGLQGEPLLLLLDAWKERMSLADLVAKVNRTCKERRADYLLIEHKTRGRDVSDELLRLGASQSYQTVLVKPQGDKMSRLRAVEHLFSGDTLRHASGLVEYVGGLVYAPDKGWAEEVIAEVASFPYGSHDDYVDSVSQCLSWVRRNGVVLRKAEFDEMEDERKQYRPTPKMPYAIGGR